MQKKVDLEIRTVEQLQYGRHAAQNTHSEMTLRYFFGLFLECFDSGITVRLMYQRDSCTTWNLIWVVWQISNIFLHFRELMHRIMTVQIFSASPLYKIIKCQRNFHYHLKTRNQSMGNSNGVLIMTKDQVITTYCEKFSKRLFNHQPVPFLWNL
jgi:hypothetical protein